MSPHVSFCAAAAAAVLAWMASGEWICALSVFALWLIWWIIPTSPDQPPVVELALSFQWTQAAIGLLYEQSTGRSAFRAVLVDMRPMTLISLAAVVSLAAGLALAMRWIVPPLEQRRGRTFDPSLTSLFLVYAVSMPVSAAMLHYAWSAPGATQALLLLPWARYGVLYLLLRKLFRDGAMGLAGAVLGFELVLGFTGFFAVFREPMVAAVLALIVAARTDRSAWWKLAGVLAVGAVAASVWTAVRADYRQQFKQESFAESRAARLDYLGQAAAAFTGESAERWLETVDLLVDRLSMVYYPSLAYERVPSLLDHEDGAILEAAISHVFAPRILFPDKPALRSESETVRKYAGVWVAGEEKDTSIAFGYTGEAFVDFGVPWMFAPIFVWGLVMGCAHGLTRRLLVHAELAALMSVSAFWMTLYQFERSWVKMIGQSLTMLVVMGAAVFLVDRYLIDQSAMRPARALPAGEPA